MINPAGNPECPQCSGLVTSDNPAVQALAWSLENTRSNTALSDFWTTVGAADVYRRSVEHTAAREPAVDDWVAQHLVAASARAPQSGSEFGTATETMRPSQVRWRLESEDVNSGEEGGPIFLQSEPNGNAQPPGAVSTGKVVLSEQEKWDWLWEHGLPFPFVWSEVIIAGVSPFLPFAVMIFPWAARCCCPDDNFRYPIPGTMKPHTERSRSAKGRRSGSAHVGYRFEADATYLQSGVCVCACCEFEQQLEKTGRLSRGAMLGAEPIDHPMVEDCVYWKMEGKEVDIVATEGELANAKKQDKAGNIEPLKNFKKKMEGASRYCYGKRGLKAPPGYGKQGWYHTNEMREEGDCYWHMVDKPGAEIAPGSRLLNASFNYVGRILDRCHDRAVVVEKTFTLRFEGENQGAGGGVVVTTRKGTTESLDLKVDKPVELGDPYAESHGDDR